MDDRFHRAAKDGRLNILKEATKRDLNQMDGDGLTPTLWSAHIGNLSALKLCCSRGGDPNKCDYSGNSALHLAARKGHLHLVSFLVIYGANVWHVDNDYHTALDVAGIAKQTDCVKYLDNALNRKQMEDPKKAKRQQDDARKAALTRIEKYERMQKKHQDRVAAERRISTGEAPVVPKAKSFGTFKNLTRKLTVGRKRPELSVAKEIEDAPTVSDHTSQVMYKQTDEMRNMTMADPAVEQQKRKPLDGAFPTTRSAASKTGFGGTMALRANWAKASGMYGLLPESEKKLDVDDDAVVPSVAKPKLNGFEANGNHDKYDGAESSEDEEDEVLRELRQFITSAGLSQSYLAVFQDQGMDMEALLLCTDADLKDLGFIMGDRLKIRKALERQRQEAEAKISDADMTTF